MRDYQQYFFTTDDTPFGYTAIAQNYFFETQDQCDNFIAANPVSPGGGLLSKTMPVWFRLDKAITLGYINAAALTNLGTATSPIFSGAKQMIYFESPRKFGVNSFEEKRTSAGPGDSSAKKGDFTGAGGLLAFINNLPAYAAALQLQGRTRDAGIVLFAYNQVKTLKWTVTEALAYLTQNNL
jgi:hypothetical protein